MKGACPKHAPFAEFTLGVSQGSGWLQTDRLTA